MPIKARSAIERMMERKVVDPDGCWLWPGATNKVPIERGGGGYGQIRTGSELHMVHRVAYDHFIEALKPGDVVDHKCHRQDPTCPGNRCKHRRCWNPEHLQVTTAAENSTAGTAPNMVTYRTGVCQQGHEQTDANVHTWTRPSGTVRRMCRLCFNAGQRKRRAARREAAA